MYLIDGENFMNTETVSELPIHHQATSIQHFCLDSYTCYMKPSDNYIVQQILGDDLQ